MKLLIQESSLVYWAYTQFDSTTIIVLVQLYVVMW